MNEKATPPASSSRPKVFRPPPAARSFRSKFFSNRTAHVVVTTLSIAVVVAVSSVMLRHMNFNTLHDNNSLLSEADDSAGSDSLSHARNQTIIITGASEKIVGQMAKIPAQNEQVTEIKTISEVDNKAGRDLLSILNKY